MPFVWVEDDWSTRDYWTADRGECVYRDGWPPARKHGRCRCYDEITRWLRRLAIAMNDRLRPRPEPETPRLPNGDEDLTLDVNALFGDDIPLSRCQTVMLRRRYHRRGAPDGPLYRCDLHGACVCSRRAFLHQRRQTLATFRRWLRAGKPEAIVQQPGQREMSGVGAPAGQVMMLGEGSR